jgi:hypothetical protein
MGIRPLLAFLLFAAAAQAGCNPSDDKSKASAPAARSAAAGAGAAPDACALVTKAEAEAALAGSAQGPERDSGFGQFSQCQYLASGERIADVRSVTVQVHPIDFASKRKAFVDSGEAIEPVSGVGEAAFWVPGHRFLYVQKGNLTLGLAVHRQNLDMLNASKDLAAKMMGRLP